MPGRSHHLHHAIFMAAGDAILVANDQGRYVDMNPAALDLLGYSRGELLELRIPDLLVRGDEGMRFEEGWNSFVREGTQDGTAWLRRSDGTLVELDYRAVRDVIPGLHMSIFRDAGPRQQREDRYRLMFEGNPQPMWVFDLENLELLAVNEAMEEMYGYSKTELLGGMTILDLRPSEDVPQMLQIVERLRNDARPTVTPARHRLRDGSIRDVEVVGRSFEHLGRPCRFVVVHDVTDRKQLERQFLQAQKMEAVGRLAAGIAHDFNNLLTAITGYTGIVKGQLPRESPLVPDLEEVEQAADRAAQLTNQLLVFSRQQILRPVSLNATRIVAETRRMLERIIGEDVELETSLDAEVRPILADPGHIQQILLNLVVNSRDAMPNGGRLAISTRNRVLANGEIADHPGGDYVEIVVEDTGCGMTPEVQQRIFEPFFTTKSERHGTGLGLATVYGIVQQSKGAIQVRSEPGTGTVVAVLFPAERPFEPKGESREQEPFCPPGSETILITDDNPRVARLMERVLGKEGYRIHIAAGAADALRLHQELDGEIDLLVTDVVMPETSGVDLATRLRQRKPDLPILYVSGYAGDVLRHNGVEREKVRFLPKPFSSMELIRAVREALDEPMGSV